MCNTDDTALKKPVWFLQGSIIESTPNKNKSAQGKSRGSFLSIHGKTYISQLLLWHMTDLCLSAQLGWGRAYSALSELNHFWSWSLECRGEWLGQSSPGP
jgi:hypothetical protein